MTERLEGKVIAIAGGAGGIGTAVSKRVASEGAKVVVGDIMVEAAEEVAQAITAAGGTAIAVRIDLGDEASITGFVETAVNHYGGLDGCHVNGLDSALSLKDSDPVDIELEVYDEMMRVNLGGYFLCTRHAVPKLVERGGGAMLYTGSGGAYLGLTDKTAYTMGKAALGALARTVANKWGSKGVRANVIAPGLILHPAVIDAMGQRFVDQSIKAIPLARIGDPRDIAGMAALLLSDDGSYVTGQSISVDGGRTMRA